MRVFKNAWFRKFARNENIGDAALCEAVARIQAGLIDADLGGGLMKQRVARPGAGKSGGYRTVLAFRTATRAVFIFGFAKSARDNIDDSDEQALKALAKQVLGLAELELELERLITAGKFEEVMCDGEDAGRNLPE